MIPDSLLFIRFISVCLCSPLATHWDTDLPRDQLWPTCAQCWERALQGCWA